ncbi:MAG: DUF4019 domain-containing protein [Pyrinomonadaceae bacterium]|nr:DUF4019 domain-containing protein [Pyrinomonadaceae bacterium]
MKKEKGEGRRAKVMSGRHSGFLTFVLRLSVFALLTAAACDVDERRSGLTLETQAVIDEATNNIAQGRFDELYSAAAEEWRAAATPEQSRQILERVRATLGKVESRAPISAKEQQGTSADGQPRALLVTYNTKFERASGMETFTLVERDGRWQLARYFVNSDALK